MTTITYYEDQETGYQWLLRVTDGSYTGEIWFETKEQAERYVIISMLTHGEVI
jgi:hypothetical protein